MCKYIYVHVHCIHVYVYCMFKSRNHLIKYVDFIYFILIFFRNTSQTRSSIHASGIEQECSHLH